MARAIDADELKKSLIGVDIESDMYVVFADTYDQTNLFEIIDEAPTIDLVKHGKWIIDGDCTHCSECRDVFGCTIMGYFTPKYCPSCGARMDGE